MQTESDIQKVLNRMNQLLGLKRGFKAGTKRTKPLEARLKEYSADQIIECIEWLWKFWRKWDQRRTYFNPTTVFRASNFERYFEDFEIAQTEETFKTPVNERKTETSIKTLEEYFKLILGGSQFARTQYMRLEPSKKREFEEIVRLSFGKGVAPEKVNVVHFFEKIA